MLDISLDTTTLKAAVTVLILLLAVYNFVREKIPPDLTALLALLALLITGILTPGEAFSGFSHPATVSVAAVLVLSAAIEHTGALTFVARRVLEPLGHSELLLTAVVMLAIGGISAFINNTAAVAIFIPIVLEVCRRSGASPGRVLMPMAHAATIGGMCTLIGTSTNLVAHEFALQQKLPGFSMFELGQVGLPMVVISYVYMLLVGRWFLPHEPPNEKLPMQLNGDYLAEVIIQTDSPWAGRELVPAHFPRDFDVELVGLMRHGQVLNLDAPAQLFSAGDSLWVRGPLGKVLALASKEGLELHRPKNRLLQPTSTPQTTLNLDSDASDQSDKKTEDTDELLLAEVVVLTTSGLIGQTLKSARFAEHYDTVVLGLRRRGDLRARPSLAPLRAGDVLVVEGTAEALEALADMPGFLVIGSLEHPKQRPGKLILTLATLAAVVTLVSFGVLPIVTAATGGCVLLMLTGCLRLREAYQAIDLSLVFLLAGSLALGVALEKTGITVLLANALTHLTGWTGPYIVLAGFFLVSVIISELMSNSGTVALLGPVAISTASQIGINPMSLLAAVTFGSSAAFAMPIGYQTSLMIYGPGGYRFKDFVLMGIALDALLAILALWLIPHFWPLVIS
ncbi:MAG: SLC13 family permease [Acidobacteria bacterium]|nr:SLC13 family permease [Acidobacteriota bacterium]